MAQEDYEQKKRECWKEFTTMSLHKAFNFAFDRAYALGKQEKDAEGEDEMLCVSRNEVRAIYDKIDSVWLRQGLERLFGSKCLPDETKDETKEPKYHVGDWVRVVSTDKHGHVGQITEVEYEYGCNYYRVSGAEGWHFLEKNLEPYTEPEKNHISNPAKIVDDILKDGFHEHNRLHVAAMAMQGMLSNTTRFSSYEISDLVRISLNCADALLAECESSAQSLCHAKKGGPK